MLHITVDFLKNVLKTEPLKQYAQLEGKFDDLLYIFRGQYPPSSVGNDSLTMALTALEFVLNAETYFTSIYSTKGKRVFDERKDEFINHFDYQKILRKISKGDTMLFLYKPYTHGYLKLSADGVIGKFHSIEHRHDNTAYPNNSEDSESNVVIVKLEIGNKGIIELPAIGMVYFGSSRRKLELIM